MQTCKRCGAQNMRKEEDAPVPMAPEREKETKKAQESGTGGSAAAAKACVRGVGSFGKACGKALAVIAAFMLILRPPRLAAIPAHCRWVLLPAAQTARAAIPHRG